MIVGSLLALVSSASLASAACTFGSYQCDGQALQQCDGTGAWYTMQTCSAGTVCSATGYVGCTVGQTTTTTTTTKTITSSTTTTTTKKASTSSKPTTTTTTTTAGKTSVAPTSSSTTTTTSTTIVATSNIATTKVATTTTGGGLPTQGAPCTAFGSTACGDAGVQYQCVYDPKGTGGLIWNQWGTCPLPTPSPLPPRPFTTPGIIGYWTNWSPYS
ncbi:UNVERIFIED_CONTAM: hypothetical protein HDU68_002581, partial [Siphonaria sp. JEL0065]